MGQYYRIYTQFENGVEHVFKTNLYFKGNLPDWVDQAWVQEDSYGLYDRSGVKLMEHSWMENEFTQQFSLYLYNNNPMRLVWCGDYAEPEECKALGFDIDRVWNTKEIDPLYYQGEDELSKLKYFVNESKKLYLNLTRYEKENTYVNRSSWVIDDVKTTKEWKECVYPISLLTALGNGRGGGDYGEQFPDYDLVGSWAGDLVTIIDKRPQGYTPITVRFKEQVAED